MDTYGSGQYDAIVIGSGPGGATVARELSRRGSRVLILERGDDAPIKGNMIQCASLALVPGRSLLFTPQLLGLVRAITLGGSSTIAHAGAFDPPYELFDAHGIDLRPHVEEAKEELPVAPLADSLVGPAAARIMCSARELGHPWEKLPKIVYQDKCRLDCDKCTMGCPFGAKWTARMYVEEACQYEATLLTGAKVKGLRIEGGNVSAVILARNGQDHVVAAPWVVLAAGGIGTPVILRASGMDQAGRDYFFDPLLVVMGVVDDLNGGGREFPMAAGYLDRAEGYLLADLAWPNWIYGLFTAEVLRFDRLAAHGKTLPIMVKVRDELGGRLTRRGGVQKRLAQEDRTKLARGADKARQILAHAGANHVYKTWYLATHPGGTAKIGDVVDSDLKTELGNLYVCDCSVIPQSWGLPPTLTLIALGKRLGEHLTAAAV